MTLSRLLQRTATFHWRTNLAVVCGVAAAVSVLAGALLVGDSVRGSLREIALGRLGRTDTVVSSTGFFRDGIQDDVRGALGAAATAPLVVANGFVTHEPSGRQAGTVLVYGVDERFWRFHGLEPPGGDVFVSPPLATEIGAAEGDVLLTRLQRPSEIPVESLFGRKDEIGRTVRLTLSGVLPAGSLGEFAVSPQQAGVRALFAPLRRIQRDLGVGDQINTVLVSGGGSSAAALRPALRLEDFGVRVTVGADPPAVVVESASGIVSEALEDAVRKAGDRLQLAPIPVFTYLANTIRIGDRHIPYSLITATDLGRLRAEPASGEAVRESAAAGAGGSPPAPDTIVLNTWAARELEATPGDRVEIDYYLWDPAAGLQDRTAAFTLSTIVAMHGFAADRRLAPDYPGITDTDNLVDWDPPFPVDLSRIRPRDEQYWDDFRATPKAFIAYSRGRELWQSRYGSLTSIWFDVPAGAQPSEVRRRVEAELRALLEPRSAGITIHAARAAALESATGATDFGEYFTYFSFFLVVSALLLTVLFFRLGVEGRLRQIAILRASGYTIATIRRLLLGEALVLAVAGALVGVLGAILYGRIIVHGLTTWWVGAIGTTLLRLHVSPLSLAAGAAGGVAAAAICVAFSLRAVGRLTPRALLSAQSVDPPASADPGRARRNRLLAAGLGALGAALLSLGFLRPGAQAGAFFGAGAAFLVASLLYLSAWLRARGARPIGGRGTWAVSRLGFRGAAFRPARSVLSAALIASAAFIIVAVEAFRRGGGDLTTDPKSGTGGYVLVAQSELPLLHNPNEPAGREALLLRAPELADARFARFRVREGQDASCLNLYRPENPTIIAPEAGFIERGRFTFSASLAGSDAERANPWLLLDRPREDGTIPVVADGTSLQYVLHARVGDTLSVDVGGDEPLVLRFVGALRDSVLQGELIMSERNFLAHFPQEQGYRYFLIEKPGIDSTGEAEAFAGIVERELQPFGLDAVATTTRLEEFHRVENTYLSTFQALGGLGLLLGTVGLGTVMFRNVLERRRELALLRAVGYDVRSVSTMILAEATLLLGAGLGAGAACAAVAIAPAWLGRGGALPGSGLLLLVAAVVAAGMLSSAVAARAALRGPVLAGLRSE
ncbi:MAG TPA: ABC transporter permease [Vicinamibacterales bacterium]|nr:ABC transporter permease [Vicinamibacterales bacterium]